MAVRGMAAAAAGFALLVVPLAQAQTAAECQACHGVSTLSATRGGRPHSLFVDPAVHGASVHQALPCVACHAGFSATAIPHKAPIEPVNCGMCHPTAAEKHPFHASMAKAGGAAALACTACHGSHDVAKPRAPGGRFAGPGMVKACGACHGAASLQFEASRHGSALAQGAKGAPDCLSCHAKPITAAAEPDRGKLKQSQEKLCLACHQDDPDVRAQMGPSALFIAAYEKSVHGAAVLAGNGAAATCVDCHGSHRMQAGMDPSSMVSKGHVAETCAQCHGAIAVEYAQSIHGTALKRGISEAPTCTDCHGEHGIVKHTDPSSPVAAANVSARVCTPCHSSLRLSDKYDLSSNKAKTYRDSYHGLAVRGGSVEAANCASCHGAHNIRPSSDPVSTVSKANLAVTCGKCHPGANEKFGMGSVHVTVTAEGSPILYWIVMCYLVLIVSVVGGMLAHNLLDFVHKLRHRLRARSEGHQEPVFAHRLYVRMTLFERLQHAALVLSFLALVVTGFMLRFPESWLVVALKGLSASFFEWRSSLHRVAGVVIMLAGLVHVTYLAFTARGRQLVVDMFPRVRDALDPLRMVAYNLGLAAEKPRFGRFGYIEKSEYWALMWGTVVMAATGVILWAENLSMGALTKLGTDIARTVHFYEAILAALAIVAWHFYFVLFNPDVYPMSFVWLTGTLTEREMAEEHPLELEELRAQREAAAASEAAPGAASPPPPL